MRLGRFLLLLTAVAATLAGCVISGPGPSSDRVSPAGTTSPAPAAAGATLPAPGAAAARLAIYAPATTSSVPVILAARQMAEGTGDEKNAKLTIFTNQSQASTLFLRGDVDMLVTGLAVGLQFFKNGAPVQAINCYVSGLTYLVTYGDQVSSFGQLKGGSLYVPFEGSPIEEISQYFARQEGLVWKQDIKPIYAPFDSSLALLKQGKARAVALPEPYVTLAEQEPQVHVSVNYRAQWDKLTGSGGGYPQVCTFVRKTWADAHPGAVARFNAGLAQAIQAVQRDPAAAAQQTAADLGLAGDILLRSLHRTDLALYRSDAMAQEIRRYYQVVGKPLDASYDTFFYRELESAPK
jgi:NitT/TauT family transport system substrate-binding protein